MTFIPKPISKITNLAQTTFIKARLLWLLFVGIILISCTTEDPVIPNVPDIADITLPTLICPEDIMSTTMMTTATITWDAATVEDNVDISSLVYTYSIDSGNEVMTTITSGDLFPVGITTITATVIDAAENSDNCTFSVTLTDAAPPTLTCPTDIMIETPLNQMATSVTWNNINVRDNVDTDLTATLAATSGDMFSLGETTLTATATDTAGNMGTCTFIITVIEGSPPTFENCPATLTIEVPAGSAPLTLSEENTAITASDTSGIASYTYEPPFLSADQAESVTLTAIDPAGNKSNCIFMGTVIEIDPPMLMGCPNETAFILSSATTITPDTPFFDELTAQGNNATLRFTPTEAPIGFSGMMTVTAIDTLEQESDPCALMLTVIGPLTPNCPEPNTLITLSSTDPSTSEVDLSLLSTPLFRPSATTGNTQTTLTVQYEPTTPNDVLTVGGAAVSFIGTIIDGSTGLDITDAQSPTTPNTCPPIMIQVESLSILNCPTVISTDVTLSDTTSGTQAAWTAPTLSTTGDPLVVLAITGGDQPTDTHYEGSTHMVTFPSRETNVTYTITYRSAADHFNRFVECGFEITIIEQTPPTFENCETGTATITLMDPAPETSIALSMTTPGLTVMDASGIDSSSYMPDMIAANSIAVRVTATAEDTIGNTATCIYTITVAEDTTPPSIMCPDPGISYTISGSPTSAADISIESINTDVIATDSSGKVVLTYRPNIFQVGTTTLVMATGTDPAGNTNNCSFNLTITSAVLAGNSLFSLDINTDPPSPTNPFLIYDETDLSNLAAVVNSNSDYVINDRNGAYSSATYRLEQKITFARGSTGTDETVIAGESNFTPIGTDSSYFQGTFDGNNNAIHGLRFNESNTDYVSLFGKVSNATIHDLTLANIHITGQNFVGGLVGDILASSLTNVSASGSVIGISNNVGGLVGNMQSFSSITHASASGSVMSTSSDSMNVGGLVGTMSQSSLTNVSSSSSVMGSSSSTNVGGLVGVMAQSSLTNVSASGSVLGMDEVGGLVGFANSSSLTNAIASGSTTGIVIVGGIVGLAKSSHFTNALAWGRVSLSSGSRPKTTGGLVGFLDNSTFTDSYWDSSVNTDVTVTVNARSTAELQSQTDYAGIYENWNTDFNGDSTGDNPWDFVDDKSYPILRMTAIPLPPSQ